MKNKRFGILGVRGGEVLDKVFTLFTSVKRRNSEHVRE